MSNNKKLPPYFKEYLDERFDHVLHKIGDISKKVTSMDKHLGKINGDLSDVKTSTIENEILRKQKISELKELEQMTKGNTKAIRIMAFAFVVGSFVWVKESRDFLISILMQVIGGA